MSAVPGASRSRVAAALVIGDGDRRGGRLREPITGFGLDDPAGPDEFGQGVAQGLRAHAAGAAKLADGDGETARDRVPRLRLVHGVAHVGHTRRRDGLDELDADVAADAREQSRPAAEHHRRDREREFVDEPGA